MGSSILTTSGLSSWNLFFSLAKFRSVSRCGPGCGSRVKRFCPRAKRIIKTVITRGKSMDGPIRDLILGALSEIRSILLVFVTDNHEVVCSHYFEKHAKTWYTRIHSRVNHVSNSFSCMSHTLAWTSEAKNFNGERLEFLSRRCHQLVDVSQCLMCASRCSNRIKVFFRFQERSIDVERHLRLAARRMKCQLNDRRSTPRKKYPDRSIDPKLSMVKC